MRKHVVTGAYGYSGRYIARRLLTAGQEVRTLTNLTARSNPFGNQVRPFPYDFDKPDQLRNTLLGSEVLYNTYWVRFNHPNFSYAEAVKNTLCLFQAARKAGVRRIVHVSITNPSEHSPLEYFRSKGQIEKALVDLGISYAILRPAVLFGEEDILVNNIAWALRRFPVFGVFGNGQYRLQPIYVDDLARLAVEQGKQKEDTIIDAVGPETFTYIGLVQKIAEIIGVRRPMVSVPPSLGYLVGKLVGWWFGDIMITRDEIQGLMDELLFTGSPPVGQTKLTDWARDHAFALGQNYASELARRDNRVKAYSEL